MAKKDKKKGKQQDEYWDAEFQEDAAAMATTSTKEEPNTDGTSNAAPTSADPAKDDLAEGFGGLMAAIKKSGGKKAKKQQAEMVDANEELENMEESATIGDASPASRVEPSPSAPQQEEEEGGEFRMKTKKEKEKEKKEKEKAKKKAQADKKKAAVVASAPEPELEPEPEPASQAADEEDEGPEEAAGSKSKKKKKKPAAKKEEPAPVAKRKGPNISALQKRLEAQRAAEEARRKQEEEERRRIEEQERLAAEEEARREEEKRLKKEREKAKKEELRKKGLLLSKKQKEQQRLAALRHEQLLAAGNVSVAGLSGDAVDGQKPKRPVYGNKKRGKKEQEKMDKQVDAVPEEQPAVIEPKPESPKMEEPKAEAQVPEHVADSWEEAALESWEDGIDEKGEGSQKLGGSGKINGEPKKREDEEEGEEDEDEVEEEEEEEEDEEEDEEDEESESEESEDEVRQSAAQRAAAQRKAEAAQRREEAHKEALAARSKDNLRSPICCILGHVDTGKTKLLDKIRQTNVQEGEAGGITQQIGATYFPLEAIKIKTAAVNKDNSFDFKIPGLLVIDTPGHESFTNLRSRGSSLCNIAILVIDIMHGLEPQTLESISLLRQRKTPFIVALNKIDRIYGWNPTPNGAFRDSLAKQNRAAQSEFKDRCDRAILALQEQGLNSILYYENKNFAKYVSIVPTSAHTGEGIPDMLMLLVKLTQERMTEKLMYLSELECTVLEVKVLEGLGTTIDVILSNGVLHEGDRIVLCGINGPIITNIRALLTPEPMREMRVKSAYVHHKEVKAALGVKITAQDLTNAIAGSRLLVVGPDDDEDDLAEEVMSDLQGLMERVDTSGRGVFVQASTLGSLEALLEFLKTSKIPVTGINIGPVHKKDIMRCATMLERAPEFAVLLCFDVKVDREAEELATEMGVKIFSANIIYHLFDQFTMYQKDLLELKRKQAAGSAVFPCVLKIIQIFHARDPIVLGVDVTEGSIRVGTPVAAVKFDEATKQRTIYNLGKIVSIEQNHKQVDIVRKGQSGAGVAVKIEGATQQLFGRHIDEKEILYSHITRHSIDTLKSSAMRDEVTKEEWALIVKLKPLFGL